MRGKASSSFKTLNSLNPVSMRVGGCLVWQFGWNHNKKLIVIKYENRTDMLIIKAVHDSRKSEWRTYLMFHVRIKLVPSFPKNSRSDGLNKLFYAVKHIFLTLFQLRFWCTCPFIFIIRTSPKFGVSSLLRLSVENSAFFERMTSSLRNKHFMTGISFSYAVVLSIVWQL